MLVTSPESRMESINFPDFIRVGFSLEVFNGSHGFLKCSNCPTPLVFGFLYVENSWNKRYFLGLHFESNRINARTLRTEFSKNDWQKMSKIFHVHMHLPRWNSV